MLGIGERLGAILLERRRGLRPIRCRHLAERSAVIGAVAVDRHVEATRAASGAHRDRVGVPIPGRRAHRLQHELKKPEGVPVAAIHTFVQSMRTGLRVETHFVQNDARPVDMDGAQAFGHLLAHFVQFSSAIWQPMRYRFPPQ